MDDSSTPQDDKPLSFWQVLGSTLAAAFGVQSSKNRERDFSQGKASHFIMMGVGFTAVFVLLMAGLVSLILNIT
ncbi:MAG: DUF2970 domain-containing protein [Gammaproteobacteria bacterium]|nr:DUF2970 domain-containing protein [Gammaproteobacteria bacterium]